jgi:hypothetical protein
MCAVARLVGSRTLILITLIQPGTARLKARLTRLRTGSPTVRRLG